MERFSDTRNRVFEVRYDEAGLVSSVRAVAGRNRADVVALAYASDGRLVGASLGDGNMLVFSYERDGTQYVQDRYGALLQRRASGHDFVVISERDPSGTLRATVQGLDALLRTLVSGS